LDFHIRGFYREENNRWIAYVEFCGVD
jgi:hypothetical protein